MMSRKPSRAPTRKLAPTAILAAGDVGVDSTPDRHASRALQSTDVRGTPGRSCGLVGQVYRHRPGNLRYRGVRSGPTRGFGRARLRLSAHHRGVTAPMTSGEP